MAFIVVIILVHSLELCFINGLKEEANDYWFLIISGSLHRLLSYVYGVEVIDGNQVYKVF